MPKIKVLCVQYVRELMGTLCKGVPGSAESTFNTGKNTYLNVHQVEKGSKSMASVTRRMHIHSSKKMFECLVNVSPEKKTLKA